MTTAESFYEALAALEIEGCTNMLLPPSSPTLDGKHAKWVQAVGLTNATLRAKARGGERGLRCQVIIAIDPKGRSTHPARWGAALAMVDRLDVAIGAMSNPASGTLRWEIDLNPNYGGDAGWIAVTADITAEEWR